MVEIESGENPDAAGYLLHELQNATLNEPEDDIEAEQRERMPEAAFLRENNEEVEIDENYLGKIGPGHQVWTQPDKIRRTLNDNRDYLQENTEILSFPSFSGCLE